MNKAKLIFTSFALVLVFLLALGGCGKEPDAPVTETIPDTTPEIFIEESQQLPRESTPPSLVVKHMNGETTATLGGYVWEWINESGMTRISEEEAPCAADMKTIAAIRRGDTDGGVDLQISGGTLRSVQMWVDGEPLESGEKLVVEGTRIVFPESGAYRYEVVVEYAGGRVYYAFMIAE